jgi:hypothetical protein
MLHIDGKEAERSATGCCNLILYNHHTEIMEPVARTYSETEEQGSHWVPKFTNEGLIQELKGSKNAKIYHAVAEAN